LHVAKKWGEAQSLKALEFEKCGELEPSSLTEVYAYAQDRGPS